VSERVRASWLRKWLRRGVRLRCGDGRSFAAEVAVGGRISGAERRGKVGRGKVRLSRSAKQRVWPRSRLELRAMAEGKWVLGGRMNRGTSKCKASVVSAEP
jgi:hypothetical protein